MAVPADHRLLKELLAQGDTARYEQMLNHSRIANRRMPQVSLREKAMQRAAANTSQHKVGSAPLLASRGLLILVNFADKQFLSANTQAQMDSMMNAYDYTYNGATGSAAQYYSDQSNGTYRPHFDVVGPVTLPQRTSYYGSNKDGERGDDSMLGEMVLQACSIASQIDGVNLANYDQDGDGEMDFVYIIYAGKGEADGGGANTIWPASWDMRSAIYGGYTSLAAGERGDYANTSLYTFDSVAIGNFAYSGELSGTTGKRNGIGTPTHEFGHVLGLPDLYDTEYGQNYDNGITPGEWDLMDSGSYNNDGKTPPNLSPWEKAFMGWITPVNPGDKGTNLTLYASGTSDYNIYQINSRGIYQGYQTPGVCYYIENRQQIKWDAYLPGHGMLIWKLDYNATDWQNNQVNNAAGVSRYTVVSATGKTLNIGKASDPFPGTSRKTSWSDVSNRPLTDIAESNQIVTCKYMGGAPVCTGYSVTFVSNAATLLADEGYNMDCIAEGTDFEGTFHMKVGYVYDSVVVTMGDQRLYEENTDYVADSSGIIVSNITGDVVITLYGHRDHTINCNNNYTWTATQALVQGLNLLNDYNWTLSMDGSQRIEYESGKGVQFGGSLIPATSVLLSTAEVSDCMIEQIKLNTAKASGGTAQLNVYIGGNPIGTTRALSTLSLDYTFVNTNDHQGDLEILFTNTEKEFYLKTIEITFQGMPTAINEKTEKNRTTKKLENGKLVIVREGVIYDVLGRRIE